MAFLNPEYIIENIASESNLEYHDQDQYTAYLKMENRINIAWAVAYWCWCIDIWWVISCVALNELVMVVCVCSIYVALQQHDIITAVIAVM